MNSDNNGQTPPEFDTAVLFLVFNRPDTTKCVFEAIRQAQPPRLYVAADGPRFDREGEAERCEEVRKIATEVDWPCEVKTLFRDENLGCGPGVKAAIDWFFHHEEAGIILEDDTVPSSSFFVYCDILLERFQFDTRIAQICGVNHIGYRPVTSYVFSKYKGCWGWATWRRAWRNMDFEMSWLSGSNRDLIIDNMGVGRASRRHWEKAIQSIREGRVSTWDWPWYFSVATQNQLSIFPSVNLVSNVGYGQLATHTRGNAPKVVLERHDLQLPLVHPSYVLQDIVHDRLFESRNIKTHGWRRFVPPFVRRIGRLVLKRLLGWRTS